MSEEPSSNPLDIDLPAQPAALVQLSLLMAAEDIDLKAASALIETDMAIAAAVLRAVNSSAYAVKGRVQTVLQAVQYLGLREVSAITYEMALRAAFPPEPLLDPVWARAGRRGQIMSRMAQRLGVDAWAAHSAGLFEECGKAVLLKHAPDHYPAMLRAVRSDIELAQLELVGFGIGHPALGAALTNSWGLAPAAVDCVRWHLAAQCGEDVPAKGVSAAVLGLSVLAQAAMSGLPIAEVAERLPAASGIEPAKATRAVADVMAALDAA